MAETIIAQKAMNVANFVVNLASNEGKPVTNLKLQKILFFMQGFCLDKYGSPIIDGTFAKWKYGPVEKEVYKEYKSNGSSPIDSMGLTWKTNKDGNFEIMEPQKMTANDIGNNDVFESVTKFTIKLLSIEPWKLVKITHEHSTWNEYRSEIMSHSARDYTSNEVERCYRESKGKLLGI